MSFFNNVNNLFKGGGGGGGGNRFGGGGGKGFKGTGQSLGGSKPGKLLHIELTQPGTLGLKVCMFCVLKSSIGFFVSIGDGWVGGFLFKVTKKKQNKTKAHC